MTEEESITTVDTEVLSNIHRKISIEKDFSIDNEIRTEEKKQFINMLKEPIRRLEFDVLTALFTELDHKPYKSMKIIDKYSLKVKALDIDLSKPETTNFLTLTADTKSGYFIFTIKPIFKDFSDLNHIKSDPLYSKLFSLCVSKRLKTLYYFLSKYTYNFVSIIYDQYPYLYERLKQLDDYFCSIKYHKRITRCIL